MLPRLQVFKFVFKSILYVFVNLNIYTDNLTVIMAVIYISV
uniref:Uncharacterized protein n=1 Tax=Anguilla anguilla TaxID=7936 RepID=A0A0E9WIW2_ANGAN